MQMYSESSLDPENNIINTTIIILKAFARVIYLWHIIKRTWKKWKKGGEHVSS